VSCAAPEGGPDVTGVDLSTTTVICGTVRQAGAAPKAAYVRLLDGRGDFVAEVKADAAGEFRFFAAPGVWRLRALGPGASAEVRLDGVGPGRTDVALLLT
jgi:hypothetical protein